MERVEPTFISEMQRLLSVQTAALRSKDHEAITDAAEAMALFLRYHNAGRLAEYFSQQAETREPR